MVSKMSEILVFYPLQNERVKIFSQLLRYLKRNINIYYQDIERNDF